MVRGCDASLYVNAAGVSALWAVCQPKESPSFFNENSDLYLVVFDTMLLLTSHEFNMLTLV